MDFKDIPNGTKVTFDNPPDRHGKIRVWTIGPHVNGVGDSLRVLRHRNYYGRGVTESEWVEWKGRIYKEKSLTVHQKIKELKEENEALKAEVSFLREKLEAKV